MEKLVVPNNWEDFYSSLPPMCSRELIAEKSQIIKRGTLANLDSLGKGIPNGRLIGKKICYPKQDVLIWMLQYSGETLKLRESDEHEEN